jgi:hypothetical protein
MGQDHLFNGDAKGLESTGRKNVWSSEAGKPGTVNDTAWQVN